MEGTQAYQRMIETGAPDALDDGTRKPAGYGDGSTVDTGAYKGKTHEVPRPTYEAYPGEPRRWVEERAAQWDRADYGRKLREQTGAKMDAERKTREDAERQRLATLEAETDRERRERSLEPARQSFLRAGGSPEQWEAVRDDVALDIAKQAAVDSGITTNIRPLVSRHTA